MDPGPEACPPAIIEVIQQADLQTDIGSDLFSAVSDGTSMECQLYALAAIADRLGPLSHASVTGDFAETAAMFAKVMTPAQVETIRQAYLRVPYDGSVALSYFNGLRFNRIDIRDHLRGHITEDWTFRQPRDEGAQTWHYYMYLASLGESGAIQKLADKIADTENGNDATNLLRSFAALEGQEATDVLLSYEADDRHADGVDGPGTGMSIADTIEQVMAYRN